MDWDDLGDWVTWGFLAFAFLATVVAAIILLAIGAHHAIRYLRACFFAGRGGGGKTTPLFIDELLESIPDVAFYKELPPGPDGVDDDDRESCAICVTPYKDGETCSVLPGCTHMFHKPCVASWLRKKNTCPLCRATVGAAVVPVPPRQHNNLDAAENMV